MCKEHYCYKIHTSLMESSASATFYKQPPLPSPYMDYPLIFIENLDLHFYDFSKISTPLQIRCGGRGSDCVFIIYFVRYSHIVNHY